MTARTTQNDGVVITTQAGEDAEETREAYIRELTFQGHELGEVGFGGIDLTGKEKDHKYMCLQCKGSVRAYVVGGTLHMFSDFLDDSQCVHRQMNVMTLRSNL